MSIKGQQRLQLQASLEKWSMTAPFHITGYTFSSIETLVVRLHDGGMVGQGEALGVYYHHDTPVRMLAQVEALRGQIEAGMTRQQLQQVLPAGGARKQRDRKSVV